jgi:hypothetical protein
MDITTQIAGRPARDCGVQWTCQAGRPVPIEQSHACVRVCRACGNRGRDPILVSGMTSQITCTRNRFFASVNMAKAAVGDGAASGLGSRLRVRISTCTVSGDNSATTERFTGK